jgi:hypothetical protein
MRRRSAYQITANFNGGSYSVAVLARSWKQALGEAIKQCPGFATFRGFPADRMDWGWRITLGSLVLSIEMRPCSRRVRL